ncbi:hypothetical protein ACQ4PT_050127 [Festuca glaucescens]
MTLLETHVSLQRPIGDVLKATVRVQPGVKTIPVVKAKAKVLKKPAPARGAAATKASEAKKAAEQEATKAAEARKFAEAKLAKAAKAQKAVGAESAEATTTAAERERATTKEKKAATGTSAGAGGVEGAAATGPLATPVGAAPLRERRSKLAADPALAKEPSTSEMGAPGGLGKDASTDAVVRATSSEEVVCRTTTHPMSSLTFAELHRALCDLHKQELSAAGTEIRRLNAEVAEAATKNRQLISISKEREKVLSRARVGYLAESEVAAKLKESNERASAAERAAKRAQSEVDKLTEVLNGKTKELEDVVEAHKQELEAASQSKANELAATVAAHAKDL